MAISSKIHHSILQHSLGDMNP